MTKQVLGLSTLALGAVVSIGLSSSKAEAHSDYWRCAVRSGSVEAANANCGTRADYDRRQAEEARRRAEDDRRRDSFNRGGFGNDRFDRFGRRR